MTIETRATILAELALKHDADAQTTLVLPAVMARAADMTGEEISGFYAKALRIDELGAYLVKAARQVSQTAEGQAMVAEIAA